MTNILVNDVFMQHSSCRLVEERVDLMTTMLVIVVFMHYYPLRSSLHTWVVLLGMQMNRTMLLLIVFVINLLIGMLIVVIWIWLMIGVISSWVIAFVSFLIVSIGIVVWDHWLIWMWSWIWIYPIRMINHLLDCVCTLLGSRISWDCSLVMPICWIDQVSTP